MPADLNGHPIFVFDRITVISSLDNPDHGESGEVVAINSGRAVTVELDNGRRYSESAGSLRVNAM